MHCSDFGAPLICDAPSEETREPVLQKEEMSQNSHTNEAKAPQVAVRVLCFRCVEFSQMTVKTN